MSFQILEFANTGPLTVPYFVDLSLTTLLKFDKLSGLFQKGIFARLMTDPTTFSERGERFGADQKAERLTLDDTRLRTGWTTGSCAVAAAKAATLGLLTGKIPDKVLISLPKPPPKSCVPEFEIIDRTLTPNMAVATVIKDAGDDPDVTHGAHIRVSVKPSASTCGLRYIAGAGVGTVTREGLPIAVGEPAITPGPRAMMRENLAPLFDTSSDAICNPNGSSEPNLEITLEILGGEEIARKTLNSRLGIMGGLSILGTTGIVRPYSCAAWVASIHRGIDVARAAGLTHVAACTGSTSERWAQSAFSLQDAALLDMGDFAGATFKYLRRHPVQRVSCVGGFAKIAKLAQGALDLHSSRSRLNMDDLAALCAERPQLTKAVKRAETGAEALQLATADGFNLADRVALKARDQLQEITRNAITPDVTVLNRRGEIVGSTLSDLPHMGKAAG